MKALLIIIGCILLVNWGLDGNSFHVMNVNWDYEFPFSITSVIGSGISGLVNLGVAIADMLGTLLILGLLIYIGCTFGAIGLVGAVLFLAFASMLGSIISLFWPILIIGTVVLICSSKKKRHY